MNVSLWMVSRLLFIQGLATYLLEVRQKTFPAPSVVLNKLSPEVIITR